MNVFTLPNPRPLEVSIAKKLDKSFARNTEWRQFTNSEWFLRILKKPKNAVVLGRTEPPGDHLFQTLTLLDTLKRNGAKNITLVLPYFGYCRHDRITRDGDHLPADLFTKLFKSCGASHIVTVDLHSALTEKRSPIPLTNIDIIPAFAQKLIHELPHELFTVVAPDHGSRTRADRLRDLLEKNAPVCWLEKHRDPKTGKVHTHELLGMKRGTTAIITDDILDTGNTIKKCVTKLKSEGFKTFTLAITHPLFSADAVHTIARLHFKKIFVANTVPLSTQAVRTLPITVIDAAPAIVNAVE